MTTATETGTADHIHVGMKFFIRPLLKAEAVHGKGYHALCVACKEAGDPEQPLVKASSPMWPEFVACRKCIESGDARVATMKEFAE